MASILSYTLPIFAKILPNPHTVTKDVAYGDKPDQKLDLYLLNNGKENPTIIFIHGGGWGAGDKSVYEGRAKKYGLAGFNVISLNYTLASTDPSTHWDAQLQDVRAALNWIKENAVNFSINPFKIAVGGDSAGGHLALWLGLEPGICAVLNMFGPCDLTQPQMAQVMTGLDVFGHQTYEQNPQLYMDASPIFKMTGGYPPTYIVHSTDDDIVPYVEAEVLSKKLTQLSVYNILLTYVGGHDLNKVPSYKVTWLELKGLWFMLDNV
jgi:acetyl esterase/lipase